MYRPLLQLASREAVAGPRAPGPQSMRARRSVEGLLLALANRIAIATDLVPVVAVQAQVMRRIFDGIGPAQRRLHAIDVCGDATQGLGAARDGMGVSEPLPLGLCEPQDRGRADFGSRYSAVTTAAQYAP